MTPGTYLRKRREAQRLSIDDVAAVIGTVPPVDLATRADWLRRIEEDAAPIGDDVFAALVIASDRGSFHFDPLVLFSLVDLHTGSPVSEPKPKPPQLCRVCACSHYDPCVTVETGRYPETCAWSEPDLCSSCAPDTSGPDAGDSGEETPPPANVPVNDVQTSAQGLAA